MLRQLTLMLILSARVAIIAADDGEIEFRGRYYNYTCAHFNKIPPTTMDSFTHQCVGHCCMSADGQRVAWYCLYFPEYKSEWQWKHMCYAILEKDLDENDPDRCREPEFEECGAKTAPTSDPTLPVPTTDAVTMPMATTATSNFGNKTRTRQPTSPTTPPMSPEPEVPKPTDTETEECYADVWFVPFLICVIVAIMLTVLVIAAIILAWVGKKRREQDKRVVYIIREVVESKSKRTGREDTKSSRTSKSNVVPPEGGGGAGPKTVDCPSGIPGEFDNYANLRTQDSVANTAAAAAGANATEGHGQ